ncbi:MAG: extracellular solute-binding protein [Planctomycetota bacterium]
MRTLFFFLITLFSLMTVFGWVWVLPERGADRGMISAFWEMSDLEQVRAMEREFQTWLDEQPASARPPLPGEGNAPGAITFAALSNLNAELPAEGAVREQYERLFRSWYNETRDPDLDDIPRLTWATDDNPARRLQMQLFRRWHLQNYGEPIDIVTDPASRDTGEGASVTKPVVQSIGGAGADILETYGPKQLEAMVRSGIALDVSAPARERGFGFDRCFDAAHSSFVYDGRQYGFPANVGYTVLLYHKDLFAEAGIEPPSGGWTLDELVEVARALTVESPAIPGGKRFGIIGMHPWPMSLSAGAQFFNEAGTRSIFNSREAVAAFDAYLDLMYEYKVMPTPAETASMAAAGGFTGGGNNALYFAAKLCAMTVGGRWEYVTYAETNFDRVIRPALLRQRNAVADTDPALAARIDGIVDTLDRDVLIALPEADYDLIRDVLTEDDRERLLQIGVAHVPTLDGRIKYSDVGARVAIVNASSDLKEYGLRFLEFLGSEAYNERINQAFDSICGVIEYCVDEDGIAGPPEALPGLKGFDSPVFVQAMDGAESQQLSPFIGPERLGFLAGRVMDLMTNGKLSPAEAAKLIEDRVNNQIRANLIRDEQLRELWESIEGREFDPEGPLGRGPGSPPSGAGGDDRSAIAAPMANTGDREGGAG